MQEHNRFLLAFAACAALSACAAQPVEGSPQATNAEPSQTESPQVDDAAPATVDRATATTTQRSAAGFDAWVADFRRQARARGYDEDTLEEAFGRSEFQPRIVELDRRQPEFSRAIWSYLDSAVSEARIRRGREALATHAETGREVEQRYGVPTEVIGAIWGVESNFGSNFGSYETIDALSTLAYDGRRSAFAEEQLYAALDILRNGDIDRDRMQGSWAGAMGHTQFIPTSFVAYAVDEDGDGRRDIWGSIPDVMGSTANYLVENGWKRGEAWGREVVLPPNFDYANADASERRSSEAWRAAGVRPVDDRGLPKIESAAIIAPAGARGPAFMVGQNFRTILRYNNATSYALAVGMLSERLAGRPGVQADWPRDLESLSRTDIRDMQRLLNQLGYSVGTPDGIMGPNTRTGIRGFQRAQGLTPDGYPTQALLQRIRSAAG